MFEAAFIAECEAEGVRESDFGDRHGEKFAWPGHLFSVRAGENDSLAGDHEDRSRRRHFGRRRPAVGLAGPHRERGGDGELRARELGSDLGLLGGPSWESAEVVLDDGGADAEAFQLGEELLEH